MMKLWMKAHIQLWWNFKKLSLSKSEKQEVWPIKLELTTNQSMLNTDQGSQAIVMPHIHSMFLHCIPATREQLGTDILTKIQSIVCNTLFRSAKFYPLPVHADKVVRLCLYDSDFHLPSIQGNFLRTKYWEAIQTEIILQTGILHQQVVPHWHCITRGMYCFFFFSIELLSFLSFQSGYRKMTVSLCQVKS